MWFLVPVINKKDDDPPPAFTAQRREKKKKKAKESRKKLISSITFLLSWSGLIQATYNSIGLFALNSTAWKQQGYENTFEG